MVLSNGSSILNVGNVDNGFVTLPNALIENSVNPPTVTPVALAQRIFTFQSGGATDSAYLTFLNNTVQLNVLTYTATVNPAFAIFSYQRYVATS